MKMESNCGRRWRHGIPLMMLAVAASFVLDGAAAGRFDAATVDRALSCADPSSLQATMEALSGKLKEPTESGLVRRERFTKLVADDEFVEEYRVLQPFRVQGRPLLGISNTFGALPALTALFDDGIGSLRSMYERSGFEFSCKQVAELDGEACEARRDIPAAAVPSRERLMFVLILTESRELLKYGRTVVACTVIPREGNPFR